MLRIKSGIFQEKDDYFLENSLQNQEHYGFDLDYERRNIFRKIIQKMDYLHLSII